MLWAWNPYRLILLYHKEAITIKIADCKNICTEILCILQMRWTLLSNYCLNKLNFLLAPFVSNCNVSATFFSAAFTTFLHMLWQWRLRLRLFLFFIYLYAIEMNSNELFSYNWRFVFLYIFHSIDYLGIKAFCYHFLLIKCHDSRFVCWMRLIVLSF